jgi:hypothetical protein
MVRGGAGFKEVVGVPTSPQQGGGKSIDRRMYSTLRYEIGHKKHTRGIEWLNSQLTRILLVKKPNKKSVEISIYSYRQYYELLLQPFLPVCNVLYSTLLHLQTLKFHCVGGCWDGTRTLGVRWSNHDYTVLYLITNFDSDEDQIRSLEKFAFLEVFDKNN